MNSSSRPAQCFSACAILLVLGSWSRGQEAPGAAKSDPGLLPRCFEREVAVLERSRPDPLALSGAEFEAWRARGIEAHARALGVPARHSPVPVSWRVTETVPRRGYMLKKIVFESAPGLDVPAHLYLPEGLQGRAPAVLNVHGHWKEAKCAPQVHSRCVFLALRGFVCLALDAIGAGERAYEGITYHGRQLGYQVLPSGMTLAGLQVLDNRRAIDLLASLPEVDPERIGVTGASGGGNQTFHLAILDGRVKAAVGVCFFGAWAGYVRGAHCACELVPGALRRAEEGDAAGWAAPRALRIIAAREDSGAAFRIEDARRSAERAASIYERAGAKGRFELEEFEGGHDYSKAMRESMVAFFEEHLKGAPKTPRIAEPELDLLSPEALRVFPDGKLPGEPLFVPQLAARLAAEAVRAHEREGQRWTDAGARPALRRRLVEDVLGGRGKPVPVDIAPLPEGNLAGVVIVLGPEPATLPLPTGWALARLDPRGTGRTQWPGARAVNCADYVLAQGSAVLGRPIIGQWTEDAIAGVDLMARKHPGARIAIAGTGDLALAAVLAGALDDRIQAVGAIDLLASYEWPGRFADRWGLALFVPGILRLGDVGHIAGALRGRRLVLAAPRDGGGAVLSSTGAERFTERLGGVWEGFTCLLGPDAPGRLRELADRITSP